MVRQKESVLEPVSVMTHETGDGNEGRDRQEREREMLVRGRDVVREKGESR